MMGNMKSGDVVAKRADGAELVYTRTDDSGVDFGYIQSPDGTKYSENSLLALSARGNWEVLIQPDRLL